MLRKIPIVAVLLLLSFTIGVSQGNPPTSTPSTKDKPTPRVLIWNQDASFADSFISEGATIRIIRDNGLVIAVVGYDAKDYMMCEVFVGNQADRRVNVTPNEFFLTNDPKDGKTEFLYPLSGKELAKKFSSRARWGSFFRAFGAGLATTTSTASTSGDIYSSTGPRVGRYEGSATVTGPDVNAQRNAAEANRRSMADAEDRGSALMNAQLLANTLFPQQYVSGSVYFRRKKSADSRFFVVIEGVGYVFRFSTVK